MQKGICRVATARDMTPISFFVPKKKRVSPKKKAAGLAPLHPRRSAYLGMSWTQDRKSDFTDDDRLYYNFTVLPATMYVRSDQLQTGTMYPHRALWGNFKGALPLDAIFFGCIMFPKTRPSASGRVFERRRCGMSARGC